MERLVQKRKGKGREGKGEVNRIKQQEMKKRNMLDTRRTGKDREMSCAIYLAVSIGSTILIIFHTRAVPSTGLLSCGVLLLVQVQVQGKGKVKGKAREG